MYCIGATQFDATSLTFDCVLDQSLSTGNVGGADASVTLRAGYTRTGGGCQEGASNTRVLTISRPQGANQWTCHSNDAGSNSLTSALVAYVIGCRIV